MCPLDMVSASQLLVLLLEIIASCHCVLRRGKYNLPVLIETTTERGNPPPYNMNDAKHRLDHVNENRSYLSSDDLPYGHRHSPPPYIDDRSDTPPPYDKLGVTCFPQPDNGTFELCKSAIKHALVYAVGVSNCNMTECIVISHSHNNSIASCFYMDFTGLAMERF